MKAIWNEKVLAESNETVVIEGNHYFPPNSINSKYFKESSEESVCFWKGTASYYSLEVDGQINDNAAWFYKNPSKAAERIKGHVAFWKGVSIEG